MKLILVIFCAIGSSGHFVSASPKYDVRKVRKCSQIVRKSLSVLTLICCPFKPSSWCVAIAAIRTSTSACGTQSSACGRSSPRASTRCSFRRASHYRYRKCRSNRTPAPSTWTPSTRISSSPECPISRCETFTSTPKPINVESIYGSQR